MRFTKAGENESLQVRMTDAHHVRLAIVRVAWLVCVGWVAACVRPPATGVPPAPPESSDPAERVAQIPPSLHRALEHLMPTEIDGFAPYSTLRGRMSGIRSGSRVYTPTGVPARRDGSDTPLTSVLFRVQHVATGLVPRGPRDPHVEGPPDLRVGRALAFAYALRAIGAGEASEVLEGQMEGMPLASRPTPTATREERLIGELGLASLVEVIEQQRWERADHPVLRDRLQRIVALERVAHVPFLEASERARELLRSLDTYEQALAAADPAFAEVLERAFKEGLVAFGDGPFAERAPLMARFLGTDYLDPSPRLSDPSRNSDMTRSGATALAWFRLRAGVDFPDAAAARVWWHSVQADSGRAHALEAVRALHREPQLDARRVQALIRRLIEGDAAGELLPLVVAGSVRFQRAALRSLIQHGRGVDSSAILRAALTVDDAQALDLAAELWFRGQPFELSDAEVVRLLSIATPPTVDALGRMAVQRDLMRAVGTSFERLSHTLRNELRQRHGATLGGRIEPPRVVSEVLPATVPTQARECARALERVAPLEVGEEEIRPFVPCVLRGGPADRRRVERAFDEGSSLFRSGLIRWLRQGELQPPEGARDRRVWAARRALAGTLALKVAQERDGSLAWIEVWGLVADLDDDALFSAYETRVQEMLAEPRNTLGSGLENAIDPLLRAGRWSWVDAHWQQLPAQSQRSMRFYFEDHPPLPRELAHALVDENTLSDVQQSMVLLSDSLVDALGAPAGFESSPIDWRRAHRAQMADLPAGQASWLRSEHGQLTIDARNRELPLSDDDDEALRAALAGSLGGSASGEMRVSIRSREGRRVVEAAWAERASPRTVLHCLTFRGGPGVDEHFEAHPSHALSLGAAPLRWLRTLLQQNDELQLSCEW